MTVPIAGASRWPLPEWRDVGQLRIDRQAARQQADDLVDTGEPGTPGRRTVDLLGDRQRTAPKHLATPFVPYTESGGRLVLAAEGQLVVDNAEAVDATQLTGVLGTAYTPVPRPGRAASRRTRLFYARKDVASLAEDAERLRGIDIDASLNPVVPLGYVVKSDTYPSPTTGPGNLTPSPPGTPRVRVAIIDTGITPEDRIDNWLDNVPRRTTDIDLLDVLGPIGILDCYAGHGTFDAGIVQQIAPGSEIVLYRFTAADGLGTDEDAADMMIRAAEESAADPTRRLIINASFGTPAIDGTPPLALRDAVRDITARFPDVLIVASAGNDASDEKFYPAAFDGVVAVGALTRDLTGASFSNHGKWVDCSAVGVGVVSTYVQGTVASEADPNLPGAPFPSNAWAVWSGTSFTAPQISAAVAALCLDDPALRPHAAYLRLIKDRPTLPGYGTTVHILRGTPT